MKAHVSVAPKWTSSLQHPDYIGQELQMSPPRGRLGCRRFTGESFSEGHLWESKGSGLGRRGSWAAFTHSKSLNWPNRKRSYPEMTLRGCPKQQEASPLSVTGHSPPPEGVKWLCIQRQLLGGVLSKLSAVTPRGWGNEWLSPEQKLQGAGHSAAPTTPGQSYHCVFPWVREISD